MKELIVTLNEIECVMEIGEEKNVKDEGRTISTNKHTHTHTHAHSKSRTY